MLRRRLPATSLWRYRACWTTKEDLILSHYKQTFLRWLQKLIRVWCWLGVGGGTLKCIVSMKVQLQWVKNRFENLLCKQPVWNCRELTALFMSWRWWDVSGIAQKFSRQASQSTQLASKFLDVNRLFHNEVYSCNPHFNHNWIYEWIYQWIYNWSFVHCKKCNSLQIAQLWSRLHYI